MARVDGTQLTVAIVAHRYGWMPEGQPGHKSIFWLECERTVREDNRKALLVFVVDEAAKWPVEKMEAHRMTLAMAEGKSKAEKITLLDEIEQNEAALRSGHMTLCSLFPAMWTD